MLFCCGLLALVVKGDRIDDNTLAYQHNYDEKLTGPFESSGSSSRYALVQAIANTGTFFFNDAQAQLAAPDLVRYKDKYSSLFTPGVSFLALPFYFLGNYFGLPQLITYSSTTLISIINLILVIAISRKLGASRTSSFISGFLFLFGSNALTYSLTLTQHHWSILVILLATLAMFKRPGLAKYSYWLTLWN
jgi:hypothetical protein